MTDEMITLRALLEKSSDADLLREMIGFTAQRLMELELAERTGADHGERSPDRINWRNGYRERDWETRAGTVELRPASLESNDSKRLRRTRTIPPYEPATRTYCTTEKTLP